MNTKQDKVKKDKCVCQPDIENLKKQVEEYKNKYLRALADYQNFEKRAEEEKQNIRKGSNRFLILKFLPFIDGLDKAEIFIKDKNLKLIKENFAKVLKEEGLEEIEVLGKEFDPNFSEVIDITAGEKDNIIVEVLRKGYKLNGAVIRVAQVRVSKKSEARNPKFQTNPNDQNSKS